MTGHRRHALWSTLALDSNAPRSAPITIGAAGHEANVDLPAPAEGQDIVADYAHTTLTLRRHSLALLRDRFTTMPLKTAAQINRARHRQPVRTTGIVTCRQRPSTASGVNFVTLEDEAGTINVAVWRTIAEKYRHELLGSTLLSVYGHVERIDTADLAVIHVIAARLVAQSLPLEQLTVPTRNFH